MKLQQLLFGYNNGHTLLRSSVDLLAEEKSFLLELSDWSGVNEINTPDYITGVPLPRSGFYAFIKSWYAYEMPRPGCVWSHVILLHKQDFFQLNNILLLLDLFQRPSLSEPNIENYCQPIILENKLIGTVLDDSVFFSESITKKIIFNLYSNNTNPVYLTSSSEINAIESLSLKLWSLFPINDRFNFSFCTGSYSSRKYYGREFRFQVITNKNFRNDFTIVDGNDDNIILDSWVDIVYRELVSKNSTYTDYLNNISDDINPGESKGIALAKIFDLINNQILLIDSKVLVNHLLDYLSEYFPQKSEARKLKRGLLSQNVMSSLKEEAFFLQKMLNINSYTSFDFSDLQIFNRILELYQSQRMVFFKLLADAIKCDINEFAISSFKETAKLIDENDTNVLIDDFWGLYTILVRLRPNIATLNLKWTNNKPRCTEIINIILSEDNYDEIELQPILKIILEKKIIISPVALNILRRSSFKYIYFILDWYNSNPQNSLEQQWIDELSNNTDSLLDWLSYKSGIKFSTVFLIARIVNPNSSIVVKRGPELWIPFSEYIKNQLEKESIYLHTFLTSLAFNFISPSAFLLLKNSFRVVYDQIASNTLDYSLMNMVLVHTKPLMFWQDWDKCKKLKNSLADKFNEAKWNPTLLIEIVRDEGFATEMKDLCKKRK